MTIKLLQGDCLDVMQDIELGSIDMVLTDPPYGMAYKSGWSGASVAMDGTRMCLRMYKKALPVLVDLMAENAHFYFFTRWDVWPDIADMLSPYIPVKNALIWDKGHPGMGDLKSYGYSYEMIAFASKGKRALIGGRPGNIFKHNPVPNAKRLHPTEKPSALLEEFILRSTNEGDTVLDPFMGSASVGEVCKKLNRNFIGIELDKKYFQIAQDRISAV